MVESKSRVRVLRASALAWLLPAVVAAQPQPAVPPEASPGVLQEQLRRLGPATAPPAQPLPPSAPPRTPRPAGAESRRIDIRSVEFTGNTAIPSAELAAAAAAASAIGPDRPASAAYDLADALTALYRGRGYVLSTVLAPPELPAQGLPDGVLRLRVVEGFVARVEIDPEFAAGERIRAEAQAIAAERPLTIATLERQLLLINDIPGVSAQAYFSPAGPPGEAVLTLKGTRRPLSAFVGAQNRLSKLLGHVLIEGRVTLNNPLGLDDSHTLLLQTTDRARLRSIGYAYDQPVGTQGLALNLFLGHVSSRTAIPEADLFGQGFFATEYVRSQSDVASIGLSYPLLRSRAQSLRLRVRLGTYDGEQTAFGLVQHDRVRALRLGANWDRSDENGVNFADLELSKGLSGLGASDGQASDLIRGNADYGFTKLNFFAGRLQQLGGDFSLQASVQGQWTQDRLPASERAALGGELILRAFNAGELLGDRALAGRLELRWEPRLIPDGRLTFYGFGELGRTRSLENPPLADVTSKGASTGVGVRGSLARGLNFYAEVAKPHQRNVAQNDSRRARFFAGVSYQY